MPRLIKTGDTAVAGQALRGFLAFGHCACYCRHGAVLLSMGGTAYPLVAEAAILIAMGQEVALKAADGPFLLYIIPVPPAVGHGHFSQQMQWDALHPPCFNRTFACPATFSAAGILDAVGQGTPDAVSVTVYRTLRLVMDALFCGADPYGTAALEGTGSTHSRKNAIAADFMRLVAETPQVQRVSYFAGRLCITEGYLSKCLKAAGKPSPKKCIMAAVCAKAKPVLRVGNVSLAALSEQLGFETTAAFASFFKAHSGHSPAAYRAMYRNP